MLALYAGRVDGLWISRGTSAFLLGISAKSHIPRRAAVSCAVGSRLPRNAYLITRCGAVKHVCVCAVSTGRDFYIVNAPLDMCVALGADLSFLGIAELTGGHKLLRCRVPPSY